VEDCLRALHQGTYISDCKACIKELNEASLVAHHVWVVQSICQEHDVDNTVLLLFQDKARVCHFKCGDAAGCVGADNATVVGSHEAQEQV